MKKIAFFDAKTYDIMTFNNVNKDYDDFRLDKFIVLHFSD